MYIMVNVRREVWEGPESIELTTNDGLQQPSGVKYLRSQIVSLSVTSYRRCPW